VSEVLSEEFEEDILFLKAVSDTIKVILHVL